MTWLFHHVPEILWQKTIQIPLSLGDEYRDTVAAFDQS